MNAVRGISEGYELVVVGLSCLLALRRGILSTNVDEMNFDAALRLVREFRSNIEARRSCGPSRLTRALGLFELDLVKSLRCGR